MDFGAFFDVFSGVFLLGAIVFSFLLSRESGGEKYWVFFLLSAIGFAVSHFASVGFFVFLPSDSESFVARVGQLVGAFSFAYACFGLFASMKKIRKKMSGELSGE